jgi:hypothetical protein
MPTHGDLADRDALRRAYGGVDTRRSGSGGLLAVVALIVLATVGLLGVAPEPLYALAAAIDKFMQSGPGLWLWIPYLLLASIPIVALHELGHALAARRLLDTPVRVVIGSAGEIAQLQLGQIAVSLNALASPAGVAGSATFDDSRARARDIMLIALAGPAADAIGAIFSLALLQVVPADGFVHDIVWTTVLGGIFGVVLNLIPFAYVERRDGPTIRSDGRLALDAARTLRALR